MAHTIFFEGRSIQVPDVLIDSGYDRGGLYYQAHCQDCGRRGPKAADPYAESVEDWDHRCPVVGVPGTAAAG